MTTSEFTDAILSIPENLRRRFAEFLKAARSTRASGRVTFHFHEGRVREIEIIESERAVKDKSDLSNHV